MQALFQNFPKKFRGQSGGPGKAAAKIVLKRASADPRFSKTNEKPSTSILSYLTSHRGHRAGVSFRVKRVATSAPRLARGGLPAKKQPPYWATAFKCWRKPIFPGRLQPSIFGAGELNFRVRDGNGWTLAAINTNYSVRCLTGQLQYNTTAF